MRGARRTTRKMLAAAEINQNIVERYYQTRQRQLLARAARHAAGRCAATQQKINASGRLA
jgi:hypothetical protein